ncbi:MAG: hypothetical protein JST68_30535 [Bacteroidetes bacterium]|nr:hypothetical protein [Bacteroidota bacterium]
MKLYALTAAIVLAAGTLYAQETPCKDDDEVGKMPAKYTDHTKPKYAMGLGHYSSQEKAVELQRLIAIEKVEEASRSNFQATGCVLRTSFSGSQNYFLGTYAAPVYGYQLAAYMNVCHITQHVVKTVDEYRTVFRVDVNNNNFGTFHGGSEDFYITDKSVRYDVSVEADLQQINAGYLQTHPGSRISQLVPQDQVASSKSDFDKINNGSGWVENVMGGSDPKKYQWLDRYWYVTKKGLPLFVPATRKEYLEALLEYYEIEKRNLEQVMGLKIRDDTRSGGDGAKKRLAIYEADKAAYPKFYEAKVAVVKGLLERQGADWLGKQAIIKSRDKRDNDYSKATGGLLDFKGFMERPEEGHVLYKYNPEYFKNEQKTLMKPMFMRVEFRYEMGRYFSEELFKNFQKNYDFEALRKMLD